MLSTMETCGFCRRIGSPHTDGSLSLEHRPSIGDLIKSAQTCPMCKFFLSLYDGTGVVEDAVEHAQNGNYTKLRVVTSSEGDPHLLKNAALKHLEITTNDRVWRSQPFAMALARCTLNLFSSLSFSV